MIAIFAHYAHMAAHYSTCKFLQARLRETNGLREQIAALGEERAGALRQVNNQQAALDSFQASAAVAKEQASKVNACSDNVCFWLVCLLLSAQRSLIAYLQLSELHLSQTAAHRAQLLCIMSSQATFLVAWLQAHVEELEAVTSQLDGLATAKAALAEQMSSKQAALDNALQQQRDAVQELAGVKDGLKASLAGKEQAAQVSAIAAFLTTLICSVDPHAKDLG